MSAVQQLELGSTVAELTTNASGGDQPAGESGGSQHILLTTTYRAGSRPRIDTCVDSSPNGVSRI